MTHKFLSVYNYANDKTVSRMELTLTQSASCNIAITYIAAAVASKANFDFSGIGENSFGTPAANTGQYVVQAGDTLSSIALAQYGDASL